MGKRQYLGDGVYVEWDGNSFTLTTSDSINVTNEIILEIEVWLALIRFVESLKE